MSEDYLKYAAIIRSLHEKTDSGSLKWEIDSFQENPATSLGSIRKIILDTYSFQDEPYERVTIRNLSTGGEVFIVDTDFPRKYPSFTPYDSWYLAMKALREKADRRARGIDGIFDQVLEDLGVTVDEDPDDDIPF